MNCIIDINYSKNDLLQISERFAPFEFQIQPPFTCSKATIETPKQCVKSVQSF